jgi:MFS family permease
MPKEPGSFNLRVELPLLFAIFLDLVGFGMAFPDIQLRTEDLAKNVGIAHPGWIIGLLLSSYFVVQIIASPHWGRFSDRIGRKPVLLICTALSVLSMVVYAFADALLLILASRILAGLAAANVVVAQAYVADMSTDENRPGRMGRMGAALTAGLIAGPAIGGWLVSIGGSMLMGLAAASASSLSFLWILLAVPHRPPTEERAPGKLPVLDFQLLRDIPALRRLFVLGTTGWFALAALEGTFGRLIREKLGYSQLEFGMIFAWESLVGVIAGLYLGSLATRFRPSMILRSAYILLGIGLILFPFAGNLAAMPAFQTVADGFNTIVAGAGAVVDGGGTAIGMPEVAGRWEIAHPMLALLLASTIFALGIGLANPTISALCSNVTPPLRQGEMFGLLQAARSFGFIIGPVLGGMLFDWRIEAPYLLAAFVAVAASVLAHVPRKADTHQSEARSEPGSV